MAYSDNSEEQKQGKSVLERPGITSNTIEGRSTWPGGELTPEEVSSAVKRFTRAAAAKQTTRSRLGHRRSHD
jgi:hypothetical protein